MSWCNVPDAEKVPGALSGPGHGKGKGVGKQTHAAMAVQDAYGPGQILDEVVILEIRYLTLRNIFRTQGG